MGVDIVVDAGGYRGELGMFNLNGLHEFDHHSPEFTAEVVQRVLSGSTEGHIVFSDHTEAARFSGTLLGETQDWNAGEYQGVRTFEMMPGDSFAFVLIPNGRFTQLAQNPLAGGALRPIYSLGTANPDDDFNFGQIADVWGDGNTFVMEDKSLKNGTDRDFNDLLLQVRNAIGIAPLLDDVIDPTLDWRPTEIGKAIENYTRVSIDVIAGELPGTPALSDPVYYAIQRSENLENWNPDLLAKSDTWSIWLTPELESANLATLFNATELGAAGHIESAVLWQFPEELTAQEVQQRLAGLIGIGFAYPLRPIQFGTTQQIIENPLLPDQWHLENTGQAGGIPGTDLNVMPVFDAGITGNLVTVGVIGAGVDPEHSEFKDNFNQELSGSYILVNP